MNILISKYKYLTFLSKMFGTTNKQGCHVSGKCQRKTQFSPGQGKVREFKKNVREFWAFDPWNFVMSCKGIVREFCHVIFFGLKLPSYNKGSTYVVFV